MWAHWIWACTKHQEELCAGWAGTIVTYWIFTDRWYHMIVWIIWLLLIHIRFGLLVYAENGPQHSTCARVEAPRRKKNSTTDGGCSGCGRDPPFCKQNLQNVYRTSIAGWSLCVQNVTFTACQVCFGDKCLAETKSLDKAVIWCSVGSTCKECWEMLFWFRIRCNYKIIICIE